MSSATLPDFTMYKLSACCPKLYMAILNLIHSFKLTCSFCKAALAQNLAESFYFIKVPSAEPPDLLEDGVYLVLLKSFEEIDCAIVIVLVNVETSASLMSYDCSFALLLSLEGSFPHNIVGQLLSHLVSVHYHLSPSLVDDQHEVSLLILPNH
jgi:hypothetical protein